MSTRDRRKQFGIEGLETRIMMAVDLPRIVPPAIGHRIAQLIAPPRAGGHGEGGRPGNNLPPGDIIADRALLRGLATAAAEISAIDAALHPLISRLGDPMPEGAAAQLERIGAAAASIEETTSALLDAEEPPAGDPNAAAAPAAANNALDRNRPPGPFPLPPVGELLVRALTLIGDRMERLDNRLSDLLDDVDAETLSDRATSLLTQINRRAEHIVADVQADDNGGGEEEPPAPVPTPTERRLMAVKAQLDVGKAALDHSIERLEESGGEASALVKRFFNGIANRASQVVEQIDEALPDEETPAAAALGELTANRGPRTRHPLPGIVLAHAAITAVNHQVGRILQQLGEDGITPAVAQLLTDISECAQEMADAVAPYLDTEEGA